MKKSEVIKLLDTDNEFRRHIFDVIITEATTQPELMSTDEFCIGRFTAFYDSSNSLKSITASFERTRSGKPCGFVEQLTVGVIDPQNEAKVISMHSGYDRHCFLKHESSKYVTWRLSITGLKLNFYRD